jgi:hypothetical protein
MTKVSMPAPVPICIPWSVAPLPIWIADAPVPASRVSALPELALPTDTVFALVVLVAPTTTLPVVPLSIVAVVVVAESTDTPFAPCNVSSPADVDQVDAAAAVMVSAELVSVVIDDAACPTMVKADVPPGSILTGPEPLPKVVVPELAPNTAVELDAS